MEDPAEIDVLFIGGHDDIANSFLIVNECKSMVVDCGSKEMSKRILIRMKKNGLAPKDISHIIITHVHYDHVKGVKVLMSQLPNARVIVHENEHEDMVNGKCTLPKGTNFLSNSITFLGRAFPLFAYSYLHHDKVPEKSIMLMKGEKMELEPGVLLIHTPGHSKGSISVICGKFCCIGDTIESNGVNCYPGFADDVKLLIQSWGKVLEFKKVKYLLPSHGIKTKRSAFEKEYEFYRKRK